MLKLVRVHRCIGQNDDLEFTNTLFLTLNVSNSVVGVFKHLFGETA